MSLQSRNDRPTGRAIGGVLIGCAVASVLLLMSHPDGDGSRVLADVLRQEAAQATADAIVHGGYVLVLLAELICFAALAIRTDLRRIPVIAAMVFTLAGVALLSASMIVDGLITPAVAARYVSAPAAKQEAARGLFVLFGAAIGVLMPLGLAFQGAAALAWGAALAPLRGRRRLAGVAALALGAATLVGAALSFAAMDMAMVVLALMASAAWALVAGVALWTWPGDGPALQLARANSATGSAKAGSPLTSA